MNLRADALKQQPSTKDKLNESAYTNENPFAKGPKLHLFKKSRRLKTSSAARTEDGSITTATAATVK